MGQMSVKQYIEAPVSEVFARAADFANAAERISGITKMEMLTDGPVGVGTRFRETRIIFGKEATEVMEVTVFEPDQRYGLAAESHGTKYYTECRFLPQGLGTEIEMTFHSTPVTMTAKVLSVLMRPMIRMMKKLCLQDLTDLKASIEGGALTATEAGRG